MRRLELAIALATGAAVLPVMSGCGKTSHTERAASASAASPSHDDQDPSEVEERVAGLEGDPDDIQVAPIVGGVGPGSGLRGSAAFLAEATRVLDTMTASTYSHKTHVDGTVYDLDCSGFVDYVLARVEPAALTEVRAATVKRPLAKHFVDSSRRKPRERRGSESRACKTCHRARWWRGESPMTSRRRTRATS